MSYRILAHYPPGALRHGDYMTGRNETPVVDFDIDLAELPAKGSVYFSAASICGVATRLGMVDADRHNRAIERIGELEQELTAARDELQGAMEAIRFLRDRVEVVTGETEPEPAGAGRKRR